MVIKMLFSPDNPSDDRLRTSNHLEYSPPTDKYREASGSYGSPNNTNQMRMRLNKKTPSSKVSI